MSDLALVVLSGGLDSATALGIACSRHADVRAITFDYGQKHGNEIHAAQDLCQYYGVDQAIIPLPEALFKGGALTTEEEVPDMHYDDLESGTMSPTYVPFRNGNLLSMAAAKADSMMRDDSGWHEGEGIDSATIYAGMHAEDAAGFAYADCTPEFIGTMTAAIWIGTYGRVRVQAPFMFMEKYQIIQLGTGLGVPYRLTMSCYRGMNPPCGRCATCHARSVAFQRAGIKDPLTYQEGAHAN